MDIEHVHEHADFQRTAVQVRILCFLDDHDPAIGRRKDAFHAAGNHPRVITKELQAENEDQPERH